MTIFDRMRRPRRHATEPAATALLVPLPEAQLPSINQRISVAMGEHVPVPSRVEDVVDGELVIAEPALALGTGDQVVVTWEHDGAWCSFETRVVGVDASSNVPTVSLSRAGRLSTHDERRADVRHEVQLDMDLHVVRSRAIRPGRDLQVHTTEVSGSAVRFASSAPFAPGDVVEAQISLGAGVSDVIGARLRIIRVESAAGSWRSTISATYDEILRSDRARLLATAATIGTTRAARTELEPIAPPPTADGVGGRDEPESIDTLDAAVEWLRRRQQ